MSGKRLRIRVRPALSEVSLEWVAGHKQGFDKGVAHGRHKEFKAHANEKATLLRQITQLEQDLATAQAAAHVNQQAAEEHRKRMLQLEQENALLRQPMKSDWLSVPPFMINVDPALGPDEWAMSTVTGRSLSRNMIVRPRSHGRTPQPPIHRLMAEGGILSPEMSNRFLEQILNAPSILSQVRMVPMRPPGDPTFHWNAEDSRMRDGEPIRELHGTPVNRMEEDFRQVNAEAVRAAFRMPLPPPPGMRTPEAEEGVRQASAEGVTDEAGGHSHSIELDIHVDDTELREVITRVEALGENISNVGISANQMQSVMERILHLEIMAGVETTEAPGAGEENIDPTARADTEGREQAQD